MLALIPEWANNYDEFWKAIRVRNLWFIRLRYLVVIILLGFLIIGELLIKFELTTTQIIAIFSLSLLILFYNLIIHNVQRFAGNSAGEFNGLHISLIQMGLDLTSLMLLVYYTGLIESPLYMFFIFHMIIGSMILPGYIVYISAASVSLSFAILNILQNSDVIPKYQIMGLFKDYHQPSFSYELLFNTVFSLMLFVSVYIANKIARQLYKREQELRNSLERLNEAEKAKQKYTIGIVHEIKTPITAVESILELIHQKYVGPIDEQVDKKIERAMLRTEEALYLINNILRISKLKLLEIRLTEDICLNDFLKKIVDGFNESAKLKSIELNFIEKTTGRIDVKSDRILLDLIFSNLISNAIKYVDKEGKVEIIFECKIDNKKIVVTICDNGIGIPKDDISKIFEQFYRASNINKAIHEGSGMGLAVVKEIVERIGGVINVYSPSRIGTKERPGACFEVQLPYLHGPITYDVNEVNQWDYSKSKNIF